MKNGSFFVPRAQLNGFMKSDMRGFEGLSLAWETDPDVARRVLPPPLDLADPAHPTAYVYVVNIREPGFAPWYMEAALALFARFRETVGVYFLNLQLSGPGAAMGLCTGRPVGLPKKLCERIVVERVGDCAHVLVEAKGRRIFEAEAEVYPPETPQAVAPAAGKVGAKERGACFLYTYEESLEADGPRRLTSARLCHYDSLNVYESSEPARVASIAMAPSLDDPWAELSVVKPLWAVWSVYGNPVLGVSTLVEFKGEEADRLFPYLFAGRWDRTTLGGSNQRYGQF